MIKLSVGETKWSSFLARTGALILYISIWIFDFGHEKLPGLSRNGPQDSASTTAVVEVTWSPWRLSLSLKCLLADREASVNLSLPIARPHKRVLFHWKNLLKHTSRGFHWPFKSFYVDYNNFLNESQLQMLPKMMVLTNKTENNILFLMSPPSSTLSRDSNSSSSSMASGLVWV